MADGKKNILEQVQNELRESKLKAAKAEVRKLLEEHEKARDVLAGIEDKIVETLSNAGLTEEEIRAALQ